MPRHDENDEVQTMLRPTLQQIDDAELRQALHLIKIHITESGQQSADLHQAVNHIVNVARRHGLLLK